MGFGIVLLSVVCVACALRTSNQHLRFPAASPTVQLSLERNSASSAPGPSTMLALSTSATPVPNPVDHHVLATAPSSTPRPQNQVFLDPGHGDVDTGVIGQTMDGTVVEEKNVALALALRTAAKLRHDGIGVVLSRTDDHLPGITADDYATGGMSLTARGVLADLQRRIDRANAAGARVFLSIHLNSFYDPAVGGGETFYDSSRPFSADSKHFADLLQSNLTRALRAQGYSTPDRGVADDQTLGADSFGTLGIGYNHLVLLGPGVPGQLRPSTMPGALNESLYLSNPPEATAATTEEMQELIASAYTVSIEQFLASSPSSQ